MAIPKQMKLIMPNPFNVYLHDTPAKTRFDEPTRAFSHACIRVNGAIDFAALLLRHDAGWNRMQVDRAVASGTTTKATLAKPVPEHVTYFNAATGQDGRIEYRADLYRRDEPVTRAFTDRERQQIAAAAPASDICPA